MWRCRFAVNSAILSLRAHANFSNFRRTFCFFFVRNLRFSIYLLVYFVNFGHFFECRWRQFVSTFLNMKAINDYSRFRVYVNASIISDDICHMPSTRKIWQIWKNQCWCCWKIHIDVMMSLSIMSLTISKMLKRRVWSSSVKWWDKKKFRISWKNLISKLIELLEQNVFIRNHHCLSDVFRKVIFRENMTCNFFDSNLSWKALTDRILELFLCVVTWVIWFDQWDSSDS